MLEKIKKEKNSLWGEFKKFAFQGNVIDLAVGMMIGAAFGKIVTSLVNDLFMPLISLLTGKAQVSQWSIALGAEPDAITLNYGMFLQSVIDFFLVAICIFMFVKMVNKLRKPAQEAPQPTLCPYCFDPVNEKATRCPHCTSELIPKA